MEVASAEQDALQWQKNQDLQEKWKRRGGSHDSGREASSNDDAQQVSEDGDSEDPKPGRERAESLSRMSPELYLKIGIEYQ